MRGWFKVSQEHLEYNWFKKALFVAYVVGLSPLWAVPLTVGLLGKNAEAWGNLVGWIAMLSIGFAWWSSRITAHYMAVEKQSFRIAFLSTFLPLIVKLAFLPIVGGFFEQLIARQREESNGRK